ncbi:gluconokinase [Rhizobium subbaraonis]|uniref:Gluconokinase n=1 Tax=Rhizobium subbaraonis TaxID=908946 RepID=A0A285UW01_9HYPH|nr:gluconokinase [Rhizobium subbaraonis]SOC46000.1 gluconokinase [Rhizobium subbaraonis]
MSHDGFLVVMGTAGTGKSEIGRRLSERLHCAFVEADDLHAPDSVAQMRQGIPLSDAQREPWLQAVCERAISVPTRPVVIACSALKRSYRDLMRTRLGPVRFLFLDGSPELIAARLTARQGHFASISLLESQLRTLERPDASEQAVVLDIAQPADVVVTKAIQAVSPGL